MIHFVNEIDKEKLRMAYNNDVLRFYSDLSATPKYAEITLKEANSDPTVEGATLFSVRLYPNPGGKFYINLQPYIAALINTRNFEDKLETSVNSNNPDTFMYKYADGTLLLANIIISINHTSLPIENGSYQLMWLAGVQQHGEYTRISRTTGLLLLSPSKKNTLNEWRLKYWQGYPFDMSFFMPYTSLSIIKKIKVINETNALSQDFIQRSTINRMVFSDGRTDLTLDSVLPMADGINKLKFDLTVPKWVTIEKMPYSCGVYLKWFNALGGYSYWLFEGTYSIDRSTKQLGEIDADNDNIENSFSRSLSIGKESRDTIKIIAELLTEDERRIVEGLLDSPKIYLFTGQPFVQNTHRDWIEVTLKTTTARIKNPKQPLTNFAFDIALPERYTQRL